MMKLVIVADTYIELRAKALAALGMKEVPDPQMSLPLEVNQAPRVLSPPPQVLSNEVLDSITAETGVSTEKPKRTRRTKAEMEADANAANAPDELAEKRAAAHAAKLAAAANAHKEPESPEEASTTVTEADAIKKLTQLMAETSMETAKAVLADFGVAKLKELSPAKFGAFVLEANARMANAKALKG